MLDCRPPVPATLISPMRVLVGSIGGVRTIWGTSKAKSVKSRFFSGSDSISFRSNTPPTSEVVVWTRGDSTADGYFLDRARQCELERLRSRLTDDHDHSFGDSPGEAFGLNREIVGAGND